MTFASRFLVLLRQAPTGGTSKIIPYAAIGLFCATLLFHVPAWGQGLFIYRDLDTGIYSDVEQSLSLRFMRHLWVTDDTASVHAAVVQKGGHDGHGLTLYKSLDNGGTWTLESVLTGDNTVVSDGVLDEDNNLLIVTSLIGPIPLTDVNFIKLIYDPGTTSWSIDPATPVTVFLSTSAQRANRATICIDSKGVIWCAFRFQFEFLGIPGFTRIKVMYSEDGGMTWVDDGIVFGSINRLAQKSPKVIATGTRTAVVFDDLVNSPPDTLRYKAWAYRDDDQPVQIPWVTETISQMVADDTLGSHWSLAADDFGNLHMSYQDAGIRYLKYDATEDKWQDPQVIASFDGSYNNISVAANHDLYLFSRFTGSFKVYCRQFSHANQRWSRWLAMSGEPQFGFLRMSGPENFVELLPMIYETKAFIPHSVLYVLFDTTSLTECR